MIKRLTGVDAGPGLTARTQAAVGGQASGGIGNGPEWAVRIHTENQLLDLLDEIVAGSTRGDRTRAEAAEFWAELLTREGHPLATCLPDENLVDWHTGISSGTSRARVSWTSAVAMGGTAGGSASGTQTLRGSISRRRCSTSSATTGCRPGSRLRRSTSFAARYPLGSSTSSTTPAVSTTSPRTVGPPTSTGCCH
jgi:hypothetical protein